MTLSTDTARLIIDPSAGGRFARAQGGRCDFQPVPGIAITAEAGDSAIVRTIYPRHASPDDGEDWVRIRW